MPDLSTAPARPPATDGSIAMRIAGSVLAPDDAGIEPAGFWHWFTTFAGTVPMSVGTMPLDELRGWTTSRHTGDIAHHSGRFFSVAGLEVCVPAGAVPAWTQPIIHQPEVGVLGILVKEFHGVLHCLMQAKAEPGNHNGPQLAPTVQATRSNYTKVHGGRSVPYLEYFQDVARHRVLADVRQSEQGSWFHRKRNRNVILEVAGDVPLLPGYRWLTVGQVLRLLAVDDLVNMDARTVLSCLPFAGACLAGILGSGALQDALVRSYCEDEPSRHGMRDVLSWITSARTRGEVRTRPIPLARLTSWHRTAAKISHESGLFFDVIGVGVRAEGREVAQWHQPMIAPAGTGLVALLVARVNGVLHALVHARTEPGYVDVAELAPTVQCTPENYEWLPRAARPRFLDAVLDLRREQILFETMLSEEGGRFYHARNRYVIAEVGSTPEYEADGFRWVTLWQLVELLRHSYYLNVQLRSLVACLHSLSAQPFGAPAGLR